MQYANYLPPNLECPPLTRKMIADKIETFARLSEDLPVYIIHELSSGKNAVVYMSPKGLQSLGISLEEVRAMEEKYYELFFNPDDVADYLSKWNDFSADYNNKGVWYTFFQQVKVTDSKQPLWFLSASTVIAYDDSRQKPLYAITLALRIHQYMPIVPKLERLVNENNFLRENLPLFTALTKQEKKILREMALGNTPRQIAQYLITSENTVRTHRRNIKKKLGLKNEVELVHFAQAFNMV